MIICPGLIGYHTLHNTNLGNCPANSQINACMGNTILQIRTKQNCKVFIGGAALNDTKQANGADNFSRAETFCIVSYSKGFVRVKGVLKIRCINNIDWSSASV